MISARGYQVGGLAPGLRTDPLPKIESALRGAVFDHHGHPGVPVRQT